MSSAILLSWLCGSWRKTTCCSSRGWCASLNWDLHAARRCVMLRSWAWQAHYAVLTCSGTAGHHPCAGLQANRSLLRTLDVFQESVLLLDTAQPEWKVLYANEAWTQTTGDLLQPAACSRQTSSTKPVLLLPCIH